MFQLQKYLPGENKNEYDLERAGSSELSGAMNPCLCCTFNQLQQTNTKVINIRHITKNLILYPHFSVPTA